MATTIEIFQKTTLPPDQIQKAVDDVFIDLIDKYTLTGEWQEKTFVISGHGIRGRLTMCDGLVDVKITIDGVLAAFTPVIESHVKARLRAHLCDCSCCSSSEQSPIKMPDYERNRSSDENNDNTV